MADGVSCTGEQLKCFKICLFVLFLFLPGWLPTKQKAGKSFESSQDTEAREGHW